MRILKTYLLLLLGTSICFFGCYNSLSKNRRNNQASPRPGSAWEMGVALYSFNKFSFSEALDKADSAGAKLVEGFYFHQLGSEFGDRSMSAMSKVDLVKIKKMMDVKGIEMRSMYVGGAKNVAEWKSYFDIAKELGMQYLVCEPSKNHWDFIDSLAGQYNIKIAIHEHSKEKSIYWHPDSVLAAIKGHKNIGACADVGHWVRSGLDPAECLKKLKGHVLGIHLKDLDKFNDLRANDVLVGTGVINFRAIVDELKDQKFNGLIYVECEHRLDDNVADVRQAIRYFNGLSKTR